MREHPPKLARRIFEWRAGRANVEDLIGDLDELYYANRRGKSRVKADFLYWKGVCSLAFSYGLKKRKKEVRFGPFAPSSSSIGMVQNYVKVSSRSLYQHRYFSFLNAFGLAIGMSVSLLLISLYSFISTYDNFHNNTENIFTIVSTRTEDVEEIAYSTAPTLLADKIANEVAGVSTIVPIIKGYDQLVKSKNENIPVKGYYVGPEFFSVFSFELLRGRPASMSMPNQVVLTESAALKFFNSLDVEGRDLEFQDGTLMKVAGLLKDRPRNTHFNFEMLFSYPTIPESKLSMQDKWTNFDKQYLYVVLREDSGPDELQGYLDKLAAKTYAQMPVKVSFSLQRLDEIVMGPDLRHAIGIKWEASGMLMFAVFAAMILLPACFNYANISIARALRRAKEIGIRKTMGGASKQIFFQFITETVLITSISLVGAVVIFFIVRDEFKMMMVAASSLDLSITWRMVTMFFVFALVTGILAGVFPAIYFARLTPVEALKSKINVRGSSLRLRKILTIGQFALSFGFILSLVVFSRQYKHSINFDLGFNTSNTVDVRLQDVDWQQFKTEFSRLGSVRAISMSSGLLGVNASNAWIQGTDNDSTEVEQLFVDEHYLTNAGLRFLAGSNFPDDEWQRERYIIVNEEFVNAYRLGAPVNAIGKTYSINGTDLEVIGVLGNFHYAPLNVPIGKFVFRMKPSEFSYANLHVTSQDPFELFTQMEEAWGNLPTERKFEGKYLEDEINEAYTSYKVLLKIVGFLGLLAITVSLLGMLGMVVYTSENRAKEVGIRKVMGATAAGVAMLLSRDYLRMMAWAIAISIPITGILLNQLLSRMQYYSVQLSFVDVLASTFIMIALGLATIVSQTYKTALCNPADILRSE